MPLIKSAIKRVKVTAKKQATNYKRRASLKSAIKGVLELAKAGDKKGAEKMLPVAYKEIDMAAKRRVLHPKTAARRKSKVARAVASLK